MIFKWLGVFAMGGATGLAMAFLWMAGKPESTLTTGLSGDWVEASSQFDARIRARFVAGTPISDLIHDLKSEGFEPMWLETNGEYGAKRTEGKPVCNSAASVYWIVGKSGALSSIRGVYNEGGCF